MGAFWSSGLDREARPHHFGVKVRIGVGPIVPQDGRYDSMDRDIEPKVGRCEVTLQAEAEAQMLDIGVPREHQQLVQHLIVFSRAEARQKFEKRWREPPEAFANAEKGAICVVPDLRWGLAHEIGHLVWRNLLSEEQRASFVQLQLEHEEEALRLMGKVMRRFVSMLFPDTDSEEPSGCNREETFCWHYAFYFLSESYAQVYPETFQWLNVNVLSSSDE